MHPNQKFLYAGNEHEGEDLPGKNNTVSAFAIDPKTGALTFLNRVSCRGEGPAHIAVNKTGKALLAANYRSGSLALLPIQADGRLGEATGFAQHHGIGPEAPGGRPPRARRRVFARQPLCPGGRPRPRPGPDLSLSIASKGTLTPNDPPFFNATPGAGPRHLAFHPNGRILYELNEPGSTITVLAYGAAGGTMSRVQEITTLPPGFTGTSATAQLQMDRAGKFLYASNRGADNIAVFAIDPAKGTLTLVEHVSTQGKTPRDFSLDPTGGYLFAANQNSDTVVLFRVDAKTGRLTPTGQMLEHVPEPSCVVFVPVQ